MLWRLKKRQRDCNALLFITQWCTLFIILDFTSVGNGLVATPQQPQSQQQQQNIQQNVKIKDLSSMHFDAKNSDLLLSPSVKDLKSTIINDNILLRTPFNRNVSVLRSNLIVKNIINNNSSNSNNNNVLSKKLSDIELNSNNNNRIDVEQDGNFSKMFFETENLTTILTQVGSIAVIPCSVRNIGDGVVSWIRKKDYHLLTVGVTTYSSDERFHTIHLESTEDWPLQIKYVQLRDAGLYECQVSTHPPTSIFIQLDVVEAKAEIFGPSEKYLKPGSTLRLTCRVVQSNEPPLYIFWYHNNRMINYDAHRGVNVSTESDNRFSELVISQTSTLNSGNYSCVSNNAVSASTLVHILNGENPAAMQHGDHGNGSVLRPHSNLIMTIITYQFVIIICSINLLKN